MLLDEDSGMRLVRTEVCDECGYGGRLMKCDNCGLVLCEQHAKECPDCGREATRPIVEYRR